MIRNYLLVAVRNMRCYKLFSIMNIAGLAVGMAIAILVALFVQHEFSYDRHHQNAERIYRVARKIGTEPSVQSFATTPYLLASTLADVLPEDVQVTRLFMQKSGIFGGRDILITSGENQFYENGILFAEPSLFDVFDLPVVV